MEENVLNIEFGLNIRRVPSKCDTYIWWM